MNLNYSIKKLLKKAKDNDFVLLDEECSFHHSRNCMTGDKSEKIPTNCKREKYHKFLVSASKSEFVELPGNLSDLDEYKKKICQSDGRCCKYLMKFVQKNGKSYQKWKRKLLRKNAKIRDVSSVRNLPPPPPFFIPHFAFLPPPIVFFPQSVPLPRPPQDTSISDVYYPRIEKNHFTIIDEKKRKLSIGYEVILPIDLPPKNKNHVSSNKKSKVSSEDQLTKIFNKFVKEECDNVIDLIEFEEYLRKKKEKICGLCDLVVEEKSNDLIICNNINCNSGFHYGCILKFVTEDHKNICSSCKEGKFEYI